MGEIARVTDRGHFVNDDLRPEVKQSLSTAAKSRGSATAPAAPARLSALTFAADRVSPVTECPPATSRGTRRLPTAPVAPATRMRIGFRLSR
jgi:hypothetical protein